MIVENFIGIKEDAMSIELCNDLMDGAKKVLSQINDSDQYKYWVSQGRRGNPLSALQREDIQIYIPRFMEEFYPRIQDVIFTGLADYQQQIVSTAMHTMCSFIAKLQITPISGGFSQWHCEQGPNTAASRSMAWMIYLNDVERGGDTEFLYQGMKVQPKAGTLVIWPAGYTHPHRGNPPYSNEKQILTGWFQFPDNEIYEKGVNLIAESENG